MKSIINLVLFSALFIAASCTIGKKVLCDAGKATAAVVAVSIGTELACTHPEAIRASLEEKLFDTKICEKPEVEKMLTPIGSLVCAPLIEGVFAGGVAQLPPEWGCTGSGGTLSELKARLIASCIKAI